MQEQTTVIVKPDMVLRGEETVRQIRARYEAANLITVQEIRLKFTREAAEKFYAEHSEEPWFEGLTLAMASGPSVAWKIAGEDAVDRVRKLNGATDPRRAEEGTIRRDFMSAGGPFNSVHGSASAEAALVEWALVLAAAVVQKRKGYDVTYRREFCQDGTIGIWIAADRYEDKGQFYCFYGGSPEEVAGQVLKEEVQSIYRMER